MKNIFLLSVLILAISSCGSDDSKSNKDSLSAQKSVDSALNAQPKIITRSNDTVQMLTLPPVQEGDIIFQNYDSPNCNEIGEANNGKYNHVAMIFQRPRDGLYMAMDVLDSVQPTDLRAWVARGKDHHVALMRLKDANMVMSAKGGMKLKQTVKGIRGKHFDPYISWSDSALYSSEMVWKAYHFGLGIELCPLKKLSDIKHDGPLVKDALKKRYGKKIPLDDQAVMPDDIYKSDKLELIYEK